MTQRGGHQISERCVLGQISIVGVGQCMRTHVYRSGSYESYLCLVAGDRLIDVFDEAESFSHRLSQHVVVSRLLKVS
jgi:hypothetical protein